MKHEDSLFCRRVAGMFDTKFLSNAPRFNFSGIKLKEFGNCCRLFGCRQSVAQFNFA